MMDIKTELEKNKIITLVLSSETYSENLINVVKQLKDSTKRGLYVTLNNPYSTLMENFKANNIDCDKCFFIDGISATAKLKSSAKNCIFIRAPNALTELSIAITETIKKMNPNIIIFDSLSTLLIYLSINRIVGFMHNLATKIKESDSRAIFPVIKKEELIKNMSMFSKIIYLKEE